MSSANSDTFQLSDLDADEVMPAEQQQWVYHTAAAIVVQRATKQLTSNK